MDILPLRIPDRVMIPMKSPIATVRAVEDKNFIPRKAHTKSRGGCLSCKRRRQKCDEAKPRCSRCEKLCFECEYQATKKTKSSTPSEASTPELSVVPLELSTVALVDNIFNSVLDRPKSFTLQSTAELLDIWLNHNFIEFKPFGDVAMQKHYRAESIRLSLSRPYLMHCLVAMADVQRKAMLTPHDQIPTLEAGYHWQTGLTLFHKRLTQPVSGEDAEALVSTSAFINGCSFAFIPTQDPAQSWPIVQRPTDLGWIKVMRGPQLMLKTLREHLHLDQEPVPAAAVADRLMSLKETQLPGTVGIPQAMIDLFELTNESSPQNNPYHGVCRVVAPHIDAFSQYERPDAGVYFKFMAVYNPEFVALLERRDERAMLLLGLWYAILHTSAIWWNSIRAHVELVAICMYLDAKTKDDRIRNMLEWPARKVGYIMRPSRDDDATLACTIPDTCSVM